jgi:murein DD-endopeptidase MepM/ murein hydrolase activator NlpD
MSVPPALRPTLALMLLPLLGGASHGGGATLPSGETSAQRMTAWTAPEPVPAAPIVIQEPRAKRAAAKGLIRLSSGFGMRTDPIHGGRRAHVGLDIPGGAGTPILASAPGRVAFAGPAGGYGWLVEIDHGGGLATRYAHLSQILVARGQAVSLQQPIALMGSTGRSTGNHLHFEVRLDGRPTDPLAWFGGGNVPAPGLRSVTAAAPAAPHISAFARRTAGAAPSTPALPGGAQAR